MNGEFVMVMEREDGLPDMYPKVRVGFGLVPLPDKRKSAAAGYPVYGPRLFFKAEVPGDTQTKGHQVFATEEHKRKWPVAWAAFQASESKPVVNGLPIEEWPQVDRSLAMTLKAANVHTVEELAEVNDTHINKIGNKGRELRAKAKAFLAVAKDTAASQAIAADAARKEAEISDLRRQIADLAKLVQGKPAEQPFPPGFEEPSYHAVSDVPKNKGGRPKGSKNKPKEVAEAQNVPS